MLHLFDAHASLFRSWRVVSYEQEGETYALQVTAVLRNGNLLEMRDYLFADGSRKYAYQWMTTDGTLRQRWDNAPHWPDVATAPHQVHGPEQQTPGPSTITNLEDLLQFLEEALDAADKSVGSGHTA
jgi:hypothetical protein